MKVKRLAKSPKLKDNKGITTPKPPPKRSIKVVGKKKEINLEDINFRLSLATMNMLSIYADFKGESICGSELREQYFQKYGLHMAENPYQSLIRLVEQGYLAMDEERNADTDSHPPGTYRKYLTATEKTFNLLRFVSLHHSE